MATKFKLKYLIIAFIIISVFTACTAFSVSYAAWVAPTKDAVGTAGVQTGKWGEEEIKDVEDIVWGDVTNGIYIDGNIVPIKDENWLYGQDQLLFKIASGQELFLKLNGDVVNYKYFEKFDFWNNIYYFVTEANTKYYDTYKDNKNNIENVTKETVVNVYYNNQLAIEFKPATGSFKFYLDGSYKIWVFFDGKTNPDQVDVNPEQYYINFQAPNNGNDNGMIDLSVYAK